MSDKLTEFCRSNSMCVGLPAYLKTFLIWEDGNLGRHGGLQEILLTPAHEHVIGGRHFVGQTIYFCRFFFSFSSSSPCRSWISVYHGWWSISLHKLCAAAVVMLVEKWRPKKPMSPPLRRRLHFRFVEHRQLDRQACMHSCTTELLFAVWKFLPKYSNIFRTNDTLIGWMLLLSSLSLFRISYKQQQQQQQHHNFCVSLDKQKTHNIVITVFKKEDILILLQKMDSSFSSFSSSNPSFCLILAPSHWDLVDR